MAIKRRSQNNTNESIDSLIARIAALETPNTSFLAYLTAASNIVTTGNKVPFNATDWNIGNAFNTSTSTFTAPKAGRYLFVLHVTSGSAQSIALLYLSIGGARTRDMFEGLTFATNSEFSTSAILNLAQGEQVTLVNSGGTFDYQGGNQSFHTMLQGHYLP